MNGKKLLPWIIPTTLIIIWQALSTLGIISSRVLPSPIEIVISAHELTLNGQLISDVWISLKRVFGDLSSAVALDFFRFDKWIVKAVRIAN